MSVTFERDRRDKRDKHVTQTTEKGVTNVTSVYIQCHCHALMSRFRLSWLCCFCSFSLFP
jgi:hypothetical protein